MDATHERPTLQDFAADLGALTREDIAQAIRNSGLKSTLKMSLWMLLANAREGANGTFLTRPLTIHDIEEMTGWGYQTARGCLRTLTLAGWIVMPDDDLYRTPFSVALTPPAEAVDGPVRYVPGDGPSASTRYRVMQRDGRKCVQCGSTEDLTIDHIRPQRYGGSNDITNLRVLCRSCNSRKGARPE